MVAQWLKAKGCGRVYVADVDAAKLDVAVASMEQHLMPGLSGTAEVLLSELGDLAVPTGAACIALEATRAQEARPEGAAGQGGAR